MTDLRVLVIDDEELVRDVLTRLLSRLGIDVRCEADGRAGVRTYVEARAAGRRFDAVILDLSISGGQGGRETVAELLQEDPHCRAIVCSGYSNDPVLVDYEAYGFCSRITKPFRLVDLRRALWEATGRGDAGGLRGGGGDLGSRDDDDDEDEDFELPRDERDGIDLRGDDEAHQAW